METIEIPRFLLDYFDSNTIHTPLSAIRGYTDVMLQGAVGPLTEDQRRFLEIIKHNAEQLNKHFGTVIHNQHYIVWEEQASPVQHKIHELIDDFRQEINHALGITITSQISDDALPIWVDMRHAHNAFASIGDFIRSTHVKNQTGDVLIKAVHDTEAVTLLIEFNKKPGMGKSDLAYYASLLFVPQRVMELHGGLLNLIDAADERLELALVFPNPFLPNSNPATK